MLVATPAPLTSAANQKTSSLLKNLVIYLCLHTLNTSTRLRLSVCFNTLHCLPFTNLSRCPIFFNFSLFKSKSIIYRKMTQSSRHDLKRLIYNPGHVLGRFRSTVTCCFSSRSVTQLEESRRFINTDFDCTAATFKCLWR